MKLLLFIIFAIAWFSSYSQIEFENHIVDKATVTSGASDVKAADIDGDGNMDILSASIEDNKIAWYRNLDGQGSFGIQQIISTNAVGAKMLEVADIDGDGDLDVISVSAGDNKIAWYKNLDGQGTFGEEIIVSSTSGGVSYLHVVDIDDDGYLDIVVAGSSYINWFKNIDGQGNFSNAQTISTLSSLTSIYVIDLNNDGAPDVLYTSWDGNISKLGWFKNIDGQGAFGQSILISNLNSAFSVYAADIDNDSDMDIIASGLFGSVVWYENIDGQGNFVEHLISNFGSQIVYVADINGDGKMDILSGIYHIYWHQNMGQGNFAPRELLTQYNETLELQALDWMDLDNDGLPDLLSASYQDSKIAWYKNLDGNGNFSPQKLLNTTPNRPTSIFVADLDSDGYKDILSESWFEDKVFWYKNLDGNGFGNQRIITNELESVLDVFAADIDGDGDMDVVSSSSEEGEIVWFENLDSQGNFGPKRIIDAFPGHGNSTRIFVVVDMDQDGDLDVVCTGSGLNGDNRIFWRENDGQGNFNVSHLITDQFIEPDGLAVADLNSNGKMDVIAVNNEVLNPPFESRVSWFENLGAGNFGPENILVIEVGAYFSVEAVDIDGDGYIDIKLDSGEYDEIAWYKNLDGMGNFGAKQIIQDSYGSGRSMAVDLDGDGDLDILSGSLDTNGDNKRLVWYEHLDGQGTFSDQQVILLTGDNFPFFYLVDMDGDGDMDIAYCYFNRIGWLENLTIMSINEFINQDLFTYPNPTTGIVKVNSQEKISQLEVFGNVGELLKSNTKKSEIDISSLAQGIYFIRIIFDNGQSETKKVIKR